MPDVATPLPSGRLRLSLAATLAATVLGCGLMAADSGSSPANNCVDDASCGPAATCDRALSMCVSRARPEAGVFLRFTYPSSSGVQIREFQSQRLETVTGPLTFDWPDPIRVEGWVAGGSPQTTVRARITFSRPSGIAGDPPETSDVTTSDDPASYADWMRAVTFSAALLPWRAEREPYTAYVEPTGDDAAVYPPVLLSGLQFTDPVSRLEVTLPDATMLRTVTGLITRADGEPVPNLSVRAEDPATGRRVSTIATSAPYATLDGGTDDPLEPAAGTFTLWLPAEVRTFRLVIAPTPDEPTFPTMIWESVDFDALDLNGDGMLVFDDPATDPELNDQPPLAFPSIGLPVRLEGSVEGTETGTATAIPVAGATLRFFRTIETESSGVTASFEQVAMTDNSGRIVPPGDNPDGAVGVALLEGDYSVTVTPPASQRMAGLHMEFLRVAPPTPTGERVQRGQVFQLAPRAELQGTVLDLLDRPAGALSLESHLLEATGHAAGADPSYLNRVVTGSTDVSGGFELYVEPGTHLVVLRPADGSDFPWRTVPDVEAPDGPVDVSLEAPVVLSGTVRIDGVATSGVVVEALVRHEAFGGNTVQVGRAETDAAGLFRLLLSPSLGQL